MGERSEDILNLEAQAAALLADYQRAQLTIATAESLTGGLIGSVLTSVPGASRVYRGGVIAYSAEAKIKVLNVERQVCEGGLVSEEVARQMSQGALEALEASVAVSCTGVAGPDWDNSGPVPVAPGTVWMAISSKTANMTRLLTMDGTREQIRMATAREALNLLSRHMTDWPS